MTIGRPPTAPIKRFLAKVDRQASDCWTWRGTVLKTGYGQFWDGERRVLAHRWSYQHHVGPVPAGLDLDHLCRNRRCVNPAHLEPVTPRENTLRGTSPAAANAVKTHCDRGHPLSGQNLIRVPEGRKCRECRREIYRRYKARKKGFQDD